MKKLSLLVLLYSGILFQSCQNPSGADENLDPKRFDGITSATPEKKFRIDSVRVYPTYADLYWWDMFDNGDAQLIKYGTDKTYSGGTIDLKPVTAEKPTKTTIPSLIPNTHYYVQFYRVWDPDNGSVAIDFTTPAATVP